jgi:hypothetical protein
MWLYRLTDCVNSAQSAIRGSVGCGKREATYAAICASSSSVYALRCLLRCDAAAVDDGDGDGADADANDDIIAAAVR